MFFKQAIDKQLDSWISDVREHANLPVRLRLWNGSEYQLGNFDKPEVVLTVREASALPLLLTPSLDNLGEAYVQEKIDLDGRLADIIKMGYGLSAAAARSASVRFDGGDERVAWHVDAGRRLADDLRIPGFQYTPGYRTALDRKSTRLNSSHTDISRMPSSA